MHFKIIIKKESAEKKLPVSEKPIALNMEVDYKKLEVWVKTNEGEIAGFAKVTPVAMDKGEKVCRLTDFEKYFPKSGIGRMMLSGIMLIAKNNNAKKINVSPNPVDLQIKEVKVLSVDELYRIYQKLGFEFYDEDADMTATNQKMFLKI